MSKRYVVTNPVIEDTRQRMVAELAFKEIELNKEHTELISRIKEVENELYYVQCQKAVIERSKAPKISSEKITTSHEKGDSKTTTIVERNFVSSYNNRAIDVPTVSKSNRASCDEAIRQIFEQYNSEMRLQDIINELDALGFKWSRYVTAASYIKSLPYLENTRRGYYILSEV